MSSPKRPGPPPSTTGTLITGVSEDEEAASAPPSDGNAPPNDGATAFLRLPVEKKPVAQQTSADEVPSGTVIVGSGASVPRSRPAPEPLAPRKGLQVSLPDDDPAPVPPPKRVVARPPPEDTKGRRGAWWDEISAAIPDEAEPARAP